MIECNFQNALSIGKAAEHLVCADLLLAGYNAFLSDQGLPYDIVIDHGGRLIRVQVKSTGGKRETLSKARTAISGSRLGYVFQVSRRGRGGRSRLTESHCEIIALVALDLRMVAYLPVARVRQSIALMAPDHERIKGQKHVPMAINSYPIEALLGDPI